MRRPVLRALAIALLVGLGATTALGVAAAEARAAEHACCGTPPVAAAPVAPAPCEALLPLTCCDPLAVPAAAAPPAPEASAVVLVPAVSAPALAPPRDPRAEAGLALRASPLRLSVVLRL